MLLPEKQGGDWDQLLALPTGAPGLALWAAAQLGGGWGTESPGGAQLPQWPRPALQEAAWASRWQGQ